MTLTESTGQRPHPFRFAGKSDCGGSAENSGFSAGSITSECSAGKPGLMDTSVLQGTRKRRFVNGNVSFPIATLLRHWLPWRVCECPITQTVFLLFGERNVTPTDSRMPICECHVTWPWAAGPPGRAFLALSHFEKWSGKQKVILFATLSKIEPWLPVWTQKPCSKVSTRRVHRLFARHTYPQNCTFSCERACAVFGKKVAGLITLGACSSWQLATFPSCCGVSRRGWWKLRHRRTCEEFCFTPERY